jgi:hypothetical protein
MYTKIHREPRLCAAAAPTAKEATDDSTAGVFCIDTTVGEMPTEDSGRTGQMAALA